MKQSGLSVPPVGCNMSCVSLYVCAADRVMNCVSDDDSIYIRIVMYRRFSYLLYLSWIVGLAGQQLCN